MVINKHCSNLQILHIIIISAALYHYQEPIICCIPGEIHVMHVLIFTLNKFLYSIAKGPLKPYLRYQNVSYAEIVDFRFL